MNNKSEFDGSTLEYIGYSLFAFLLNVITFGILSWYTACMLMRWQTKHTLIEGRRLQFNGKALDLFLNSIVWVFLTIITLGIYALWVPVKFMKWKAERTVFMAPEAA